MACPTLMIDPTPPKQGDEATVSYTGPLPGTATVYFTDSNGQQLPPVTIEFDANGEATVEIPDNAEAMRVVDDQGLANAASTNIAPAG